MKILELARGAADYTVRLDLGDLWREAETLGIVENLGRPTFGNDADYEAVIRMGRITESHAKVRAVAKSPEAALSEAIAKARVLSDAVKAVSP